MKRSPIQVIAFKALPLTVAPYDPRDARLADVRHLWNEVTLAHVHYSAEEMLLLASVGFALDKPAETTARLILGLAIQAAAKAWAAQAEPGTIQSQPEYYWNEGQYA